MSGSSRKRKSVGDINTPRKRMKLESKHKRDKHSNTDRDSSGLSRKNDNEFKQKREYNITDKSSLFNAEIKKVRDIL